MKLRLALLAMVACVAGARTLHAATATTTFTVTASVSANCTITATGINFTYDPITPNATTAASPTRSVTIACTTRSGPSIGLNAGNHARTVGGGQRRMATRTNL